ncbi:cytochrome b5 reductase 4 isoform X1 [Diorhabda sublineata]|uniref:cytochrome b5 reductase 4 isoform X1 n=1 Tax=Diorhabda sublineata TaxID=1163346 RepID=UPI0024E0E903|nr:cytochrome b5 reductase 4 isoform X1 [Diorhabda sublineata]
MDTTKSPNKVKKSVISNLLNDKVLKTPTFVSPVLQQVGKLAASVANVGVELSSSGSATGNPRNKCALQPGHSLMDWIRLGASGKDLTGLGPRAGHLSVTKQELAKHNTIDDLWLSIRGKVYNVTAYVPFHPGGPDELLRAAGIDATKLFDQVHPWVNYEQILQKCIVGKLVAIDPNIDKERLFFGKTENSDNVDQLLQERDSTEVEKSQESTPANESGQVTLRTDELKANIENIEEDSNIVSVPNPDTPRFDWIQKMDYITLIFYTGSFSNPLVEVHSPQAQKELVVCFTYNNAFYRNQLLLNEDVEWPCSIKVTWETGKIELTFKKKIAKIWENCGMLQQNAEHLHHKNASERFNFVIEEKLQVTHNIFLMRFKRIDGCKIVVPIGKHVRVFVNIDGSELSRSYTPVPSSLFTTLSLNDDTTDEICLMIKSYKNGMVSRMMTDKDLKDVLTMTRPLGDFDLQRLEKKVAFLILAAGTGITPMLPLLLFLLERRVKKCQFVRLLFFNKKEQDIPFGSQLSAIVEMDRRLVVNHILSEPVESWTGLSGHVNKEMINNAIQEHIKDTGYTIKDIFAFICGPNQFSELSLQELHHLDVTEEQIHIFSG